MLRNCGPIPNQVCLIDRLDFRVKQIAEGVLGRTLTKRPQLFVGSYMKKPLLVKDYLILSCATREIIHKVPLADGLHDLLFILGVLVHAHLVDTRLKNPFAVILKVHVGFVL